MSRAPGPRWAARTASPALGRLPAPESRSALRPGVRVRLSGAGRPAGVTPARTRFCRPLVAHRLFAAPGPAVPPAGVAGSPWQAGRVSANLPDDARRHPVGRHGARAVGDDGESGAAGRSVRRRRERRPRRSGSASANAPPSARPSAPHGSTRPVAGAGRGRVGDEARAARGAGPSRARDAAVRHGARSRSAGHGTPGARHRTRGTGHGASDVGRRALGVGGRDAERRKAEPCSGSAFRSCRLEGTPTAVPDARGGVPRRA